MYIVYIYISIFRVVSKEFLTDTTTQGQSEPIDGTITGTTTPSQSEPIDGTITGTTTPGQSEPIDRTITGTTTPGQNEPENNGNEVVLHTSLRFRIGTSPSDEV